jgi:hypothetical protein
VSTPTDPPSPAEPALTRPPSTEEIPVVAPAGATAVTRQPLPPHPGATPPAPVPPAPTAGPQPTGPVDFVPGLPGLSTPPVPPPPPAPAPPTGQPTAQPTTAQPTAAQPTTAAQPAVAAEPGSTWPETLESDAPAPARSRGLRTPSGPRDRKALLGVGLAALAVVLVLLGLTLDFGTASFWSVVPLWSAFATLCAVLGLLAFAAFYPAGNRLRSGPAWKVAAAGLVGLSAFWLLVVLPVVDSDRGFVLTAAVACLGGALWIGPRTRA